jgi:hypothetical protein
MARTKDASKHPALVQRVRTEEVLAAQLDEDNIASIDDWDSFESNEKRFLLAYPYFRSQAETCQYIGVGKHWADKHKAPAFKAAMNVRLRVLSAIARPFMMDLIGKSMIALDDIITRDKDGRYGFNDHVTMKAIEHIHKATRLVTDDLPANTTLIRADKIEMFDTKVTPSES